MTSSSGNTSIQLFNILDVVFGTDDIIRCRRKNLRNAAEFEHPILNLNVHLLGSKSNGFNSLEDSDFDFMFVDKQLYIDDT